MSYLVPIQHLCVISRMAPKDTHILISGTSKYLTLHDKSNFAYVSEKLPILNGEIILDYQGLQRGLYKERILAG